MCGVIGLIYERSRGDLGRIAAELLRTLEYRGYDSTGAAIQDDLGDERLVKGVGSPSAMVERLGIVRMSGQIFCGQVRWATFGAVNEANSQPHVVRCKTHLYGAHNGNVTNCDALKLWLTEEGHEVLSDNDGEMVVHAVEHYFAQALRSEPSARREEPDVRRRAMRAAISQAAGKLEGSFAAVIVDPVARVLWAIKAGSSLYFGLGRDPVGGRFCIASSDLSSVLKLTRVIVPLSEGELVEYDAKEHHLFRLERGPQKADPRPLVPIERTPVRNRLRSEDIALTPPHTTFMEQEIAAQETTVRNVVRMFGEPPEAVRILLPYLEALAPAERDAIKGKLEMLRDQYAEEAIARHFVELADAPTMDVLRRSVPDQVKAPGVDASPEQLAARLISSEAHLFSDLLKLSRHKDDLLTVRVLDVLTEREEASEFTAGVDGFVELAARAVRSGGRLFVICCGSSLHAAKAGALFFNEIARTDLVPLLPGEFRAQYSRSLHDGDVVVAVSQSGETKDLIDVMNDVIASGKRIDRIAIVNNVNSTLGQEKADVVIPLRCGAEIAVPATKSFTNQLAVFYGLGLRLAKRRATENELTEAERTAWQREIEERAERFAALPSLIRATLLDTSDAIESAAQMLFLCPSLHLLAMRNAALAKEGALKIREVVLNHAEGYEGSEFKHGPNTILGFNTIFGMRQIEGMLKQMGGILDALFLRGGEKGLQPAAVRRMMQAVTDSVTSPAAPSLSLAPEQQVLLDKVFDRQALFASLYSDYPLIYITGPDERDVALTVSQINTHKIRGAMTIVIAEEQPELRAAAQKAPADNSAYRWAYLALPRTNDTLSVTFSAIVVLQRLALRMSLLKASYLDRLGVKDHGVHPDVPKNVSKSITVD